MEAAGPFCMSMGDPKTSYCYICNQPMTVGTWTCMSQICLETKIRLVGPSFFVSGNYPRRWHPSDPSPFSHLWKDPDLVMDEGL